MLSKNTIKEQKMNSKIIRDFAPTKDNNRNSEGAFITLKNGNIMFAYSRYGGYGDDDGAAADIYASISADGGESFGEPYPLITHTEMNADNIMSASFMRMPNGDIGLFFLVKTEIVNCLSYLIRSSDEGKTWSKPRFICKGFPTHLQLFGKDKLIMTYTYRLKPYGIRARISDDSGKSWSEEIILSDDGRSWDLGYPSTVEMADGTLFTLWYENRGKGGAKLRYLRWKLNQ